MIERERKRFGWGDGSSVKKKKDAVHWWEEKKKKKKKKGVTKQKPFFHAQES